MAPPRDLDPASAGGSGATVDEYDALCEELAQTQGVINVAEARLVALTARALEIGVSGGTNLSMERWVAWRAGVSPARAAGIVRVARRAEELPCTMAALAAGELTVDQAAEVARYVPARYDESAARVASCCTVRQLRQALPHYRDPEPVDDRAKPTPGSDAELEARGRVATGYDERGYFAHIRLPEAKGAIVDQALKAMHEDLKRQAAADAPDGVDPEPVYAADALTALAETALAAGEAARPGTDRYLVHAHLEAGPNGLELMTHLGVPLPEGQRRHILCDVRMRALVHDGIAPLGSGRVTRAINRRLRRAIEHRDGGCAVPGCGRTTGLEIHHIRHWEDGGPTETWNLIALCRYHHSGHHQGSLDITGNADLPRHTAPGVVFTNAWGQPLGPVGQPVRPAPPGLGITPGRHVADSAAGIGIAPHRYVPPTGERLDRSGFHLQEADPPEPPPADPVDDDGDPPPPTVTGQRPGTAPPAPTSPTGGAPTDPTRAGPATT